MEGSRLPCIFLLAKSRTGICGTGKYNSVIRGDNFRSLEIAVLKSKRSLERRSLDPRDDATRNPRAA
jgi:hypothetical protein